MIQINFLKEKQKAFYSQFKEMCEYLWKYMYV